MKKKDKSLTFELLEFNKPDKDNDIFLKEGMTIPILWRHDPKKPFGKITQEGIKNLNSFFINKQRCILDPAYIIKKSRKPTLKERIQDPGVKTIIEDCELLEVSVIPVPIEIPELKENIFILFCHHLATIINKIKQKINKLI